MIIIINIIIIIIIIIIIVFIIDLLGLNGKRKPGYGALPDTCIFFFLYPD